MHTEEGRLSLTLTVPYVLGVVLEVLAQQCSQNLTLESTPRAACFGDLAFLWVDDTCPLATTAFL